MNWISTKPVKHKTVVFKIQAVSMFIAACLMISNLYASQNWPSFRGLSASGVTEGYSTPTRWDAAQSENILWKTPIPGLGHSCPAVWDDRIFVTTAVQDQGQSSLKVGMYGDVESVDEKDAFSWHIYCIDRKTGAILWDRQSYRGKPKVKRHPKSSHANSTPCTDGN